MMISKAIVVTMTTLMATAAYSADMDQILFGQSSDAVNIEPLQHGSTNIAGYVEGAFGYAKGKAGEYEADGTTWALRGTVNSQANRNVNIQIDAGYERMNVESVGINNFAGAVHAYYRQPDTYAVGAFVQGARIGSNVFDILSSLELDDYATDVVAGAEAAVYTDNVSYFGQLGFGQASYSGESANHLLARAGVRLYANDNFRFDTEGALNRLSVTGVEANVYTLSGTGHYRLTDFPVTASLGYRYNYGEAKVLGESVGSANSHTILTGLRFSFGSTSLKDEERTGPAWTNSELKL